MTLIEIIIDTKGQAQVQTKGYAGSACQDATRLLEQVLGSVQSDVRTAEFYQPAQVDAEQRQRS